MKDKKGSVLWRVAGGGKTWVDKGVGSNKRIMSWRYPIEGGGYIVLQRRGDKIGGGRGGGRGGWMDIMAGGSRGRGRRRGRGG